LRINENVIFTKYDVMKYAIGALQWKLPQAIVPFIRLCLCPAVEASLTSSAARSKILGGQNVLLYLNNTILFGIPPLKAQNDYVF